MGLHVALKVQSLEGSRILGEGSLSYFHSSAVSLHNTFLPMGPARRELLLDQISHVCR